MLTLSFRFNPIGDLDLLSDRPGDGAIFLEFTLRPQGCLVDEREDSNLVGVLSNYETLFLPASPKA